LFKILFLSWILEFSYCPHHLHTSTTKTHIHHTPKGLTLNQNFLYLCDYSNHRIQILDKINNFSFHKLFGKYGRSKNEFFLPYSIYLYQSLLYIGDEFSVQIFTNDNCKFIQRIGDDGVSQSEGKFSSVWGICVVDDCLYVSDTDNRRIQVFKIKTEFK